MSIVLAPVAFWALGLHRVPADDGKQFEIKFRARFTRLTVTQRREVDQRLIKAVLVARGELVPEHLQAVEPLTDKAFLDLVLCDWEIADMQGAKVPYTEQNRIELFDAYEGLEGAFVKAYQDATAPKEAEKNSAAPSATT